MVGLGEKTYDELTPNERLDVFAAMEHLPAFNAVIYLNNNGSSTHMDVAKFLGYDLSDERQARIYNIRINRLMQEGLVKSDEERYGYPNVSSTMERHVDITELGRSCLEVFLG